MDHADSCELTVNDARTGEQIDKSLPNGRSPDVREMLGDLRRQHGAESPIGYRCTNLLEQLERLAKETDGIARANIGSGIKRQMADLASLRRGNHS